jgi:hypothetical protein
MSAQIPGARSLPLVSAQSTRGAAPLLNSSASDDAASTGGATEDAHNRRNRMAPNNIRESSILDRNSRSVHNRTQGSILDRNRQDQEPQRLRECPPAIGLPLRSLLSTRPIGLKRVSHKSACYSQLIDAAGGP